MANSVDLLMMRLESRMFSKLCESAKTSDNTVAGVSFEEMLDCACGGAVGSAAGADGQVFDAGEMRVSDKMVKFIEEHEGFSATAYNGADYWNSTIGYGHVISEGEEISALTKSSAEKLLREDLKACEASVNKEFKGTKLTQNQFDALVSFAYNLGPNIWSRTPKLVSDIKSGASPDVIKADFENCAKCGGRVVEGLVNRRLDEWNVFANGVYSGN